LVAADCWFLRARAKIVRKRNGRGERSTETTG
jgi:hypothetical protein